MGQIWSQIEKLIFLGIGNCSWAGFQWRFSSRDVDIYVDNKQSISFSKNITVNSKLRTTFNLKDKRIQEMRDDKIVNAKYALGIDNPADLLTKVQPAYKHNLLLKLTPRHLKHLPPSEPPRQNQF